MDGVRATNESAADLVWLINHFVSISADNCTGARSAARSPVIVPMVDHILPAPGPLPVAKRALVFWIAGAAGSGGGAVAALVRARLRDDGIDVLVLDDGGLPPSALAGLCGAGRGRYHAILVAAISPPPAASAAARAALAPGFYQIDCVAGCGDWAGAAPDVSRDQSWGRPRRLSRGQSWAASRGEPTDGPPASPDLRIDTGAGRYALATARLLTFVRARLARHPAVAARGPAAPGASATLTLRAAAE